MSENCEEIAKEILINALDKGVILFPGKGSFESVEQLQDYNEKRITEITKAYRSILTEVVNAVKAQK